MSKICIAGKNDIAVNSLNYLLKNLNISSSDILAVINKTDNGEDTWQKSFKKAALKNNINIVTLDDVYDFEDLIFISLEFDRIIKPEKFKSKKLYNMHFSKLPAYKGMYTSIMPILNGEAQSGVTFHYIDKGIDTGDIIKQRVFDIDIKDTGHDLYYKYLENSYELFKEVIRDVLSNKVTSYKQMNTNSSYYSKKTIDFTNINIDYNKTSYEIYNQIRAFIFEEYQLPKINNSEICNVELTNDFIGYNKLEENASQIVISGIDGFKIISSKKIL